MLFRSLCNVKRIMTEPSVNHDPGEQSKHVHVHGDRPRMCAFDLKMKSTDPMERLVPCRR